MDSLTTGKVIKIHSDFLYVKCGHGLFECKIRERLKKEKVGIFVGDYVKIGEINSESSQAVIVEVIERQNFIPRPSVANIDQVVIVASIEEPEFDFIQINRYLTQAEIYNIPALICLNKTDFHDKKDLKSQIKLIYEPLGYRIAFTSALSGTGIDELKELLANKVSVLCGASGVGKSSLLNKISPELSLRTKKLSSKNKKGTHTTRHVELLEIQLDKNICIVADTPGFSNLKFDTIMPCEIQKFFKEIFEFSKECYFSDCVHTEEENCGVLNNLDKIHPCRYQSYKIFLEEAFEYKKKASVTSQKDEGTVKSIDSQDKTKTRLVKVGVQLREKSRKQNKQKINFFSKLNDIEYNDFE
jgi:ribosome biogenesis GTPase